MDRKRGGSVRVSVESVFVLISHKEACDIQRPSFYDDFYGAGSSGPVGALFLVKLRQERPNEDRICHNRLL